MHSQCIENMSKEGLTHNPTTQGYLSRYMHYPLKGERKWSCSVMSDSLSPYELSPSRLLCPWDFPGKNTGVGCHFLLQDIFPTQGSKLGLPHCRQTLYLWATREALTIPSVQFSRSVVSDSLRPHESQHTRPPCPSPTPRVHSSSRPSSQWCHPAISSSVVPFSSCPQSLPASGSLPMSQLF